MKQEKEIPGNESDDELTVTALLSERSLAKEWLMPEEDRRAWDYLERVNNSP